jgi:hypothetical protein
VLGLIAAAVGLVLALWEPFSALTGRPKVTELSHRWPWSLAIWSWWLLLGVHLFNARDDD